MEKTPIQMKLNGRGLTAYQGETILEASARSGIKIPTLCNLPEISTNASCAICVVEVSGAKSLLRACVTKVSEGMNVITDSERVREARRTNLELMLANHPKECLSCIRSGNCEFRTLVEALGIREERFERTRKRQWEVDRSSPSLVRDPNKCILCGRCIGVCMKVQSVQAIDFTKRGINTKVTMFMDRGLGTVACMNCGQCALACPTAAIVERDQTEDVFKAILDPEKFVVVQTAPAIRVGIGEAMGMGPGALVTGKMVAGLRRLGFDRVFDTQFTADLTIMEEGHELVERLTKGGVLPMITSCSPGWIKFIEHEFPKLLPHLSSCKSPQQMFGSLAKTYFAEREGIDPRKIVVVSIMPCTAKKFEAERPEMDGAFRWWKKKGAKEGGVSLKDSDRFPDVDYALTTRELARMFRQSGVDLPSLAEENFDSPLGESTGAAVIFGATGGVMEASLRTAYEVVTGKTLPSIDFKAVRGLEGIKSSSVDLAGLKLEVGVAHTLGNARKLLDEIAAGKSPYGFIEIMSCPGGCLGGGGQPIPTNSEIRKARMESIYREDSLKGIRKSHENPEVAELYKRFLGKPLGHVSHELLHTAYTERSYY